MRVEALLGLAGVEGDSRVRRLAARATGRVLPVADRRPRGRVRVAREE